MLWILVLLAMVLLASLARAVPVVLATGLLQVKDLLERVICQTAVVQ
jgi:hypothetical protein